MVIATILALMGMIVAGLLLNGQIGPEAHKITLPLPFAINGANSVDLTSLQVIGGLFVLIVGVVAVVGVGLSFFFTRFQKQTATVIASDLYQSAQSALKQRTSDALKARNADRATDGIPNHKRAVQTAVSASLIILLFTIFLGALLNFAFIPESEYVVDGRAASGINTLLIWLILVSAFILVWRRQRFKAQASDEPVSWDNVWIAGAGLLVVGGGLTAVLYFSGSPDAERVINSAIPVVGGLALTALLLLAWFIRPQSFAALDEADNAPIPWDLIVVLLSGLLVVGLGLAVTAYLNSPF